MTEDGEEVSLVMPFVCVASRGGPYDDEAFTAGFHAGMLWRDLADIEDGEVVTVRATLESQLDLIAMHHGRTARVLDRDLEGGWINVEIRDDVR